MKSNQKGFGFLGILALITIIGLIGAVGWLVYDRQKSKSSDSSSTQVGTQQKEEPKKEEVKNVNPNQGYLVVTEWGLRFKAPSGITDIKYAIQGDTAAFFAKPTNSSVQYSAGYDKFEDGRSQYAIGNLYRSTGDTRSTGEDESVQGKKVGNHYYYTSWSFSSLASGAACVGLYGDSDTDCQLENTVFQLVNQGDTALLNTIEVAQ